MATRNFHNSNKKTKYGEHDVKFWIGTVVSYASQEEQLENGFGWMYRVRIDGDHSNDRNKIKDKQLSYAYCILPTTAGSGAAFKLRSVRISQGDTVFGLRGGGVGAPAFIIGVFPRTRETIFATPKEIEKGIKSGGLTGFYGSLVKNETLTGEFNDQIGPKTPDVTSISPENYTKAERKDPSEKIEKFGIDKNQKENITEEQTKKLDVKKTPETKEWNPTKVEINDSSKRNTPKDSIVTSQIKNLLTNVDGNKVQSVVDSITPKVERDIDPNTGLYFGQSAHQYQGGVAEYWKKIESQRELTEREKRYKKKGYDQYGGSLEYNLREVVIVEGIVSERVKAENGTYVYEFPKPAITYKKEYNNHVVAAIEQGLKQNLLDKDVALAAINAVRRGDYERANLIIFPPEPPTTG
tara:strand:- start:890 stop:2119 length:1230 start_codon:yes stop_codon:yes gene_type:complete